MENILLTDFITPFETVPFSKINNEDFEPAIEKGITLAKEEIEAIKNNTVTPNFENTVLALEAVGKSLDQASTVLFNLNSSETNDEIQKICRDVSPSLTKYSNDIILDLALFERVKYVFDHKAILGLNQEQTTLLEKSYKGFVRNGALLNDKEKEKLRLIDEEKSKISLEFSEHVLADTNAYELIIDKEENLAGIPEQIIEAAAGRAKSKNYEGKWLFTLDYPSFVPFLTYADNRTLRQAIHKAFAAVGHGDNENNNESIVIRIANLRHQRAQLLGYESHAHFTLEERMASNPAAVFNFLNSLYEKAINVAKEEVAELQSYAEGLGFEGKLQKWDFAYYSEKLKKEKYNIDQEMLKPYFQLDKVLAGAFEVANKLYGISFNKIDTIDTYHEEVDTYEVKDENGKHLAIFYADFHPREGKRNGAWKTSFRSQFKKDGKDNRPHIIIVCNFPRPTASAPSLLSFGDVTTLFHEFGHALHGILSNVTYSSLSGTSVFWDFVELPSQVMENWVFEQECLDLFAKHYETGESIPLEYVKRIQESAQYHEGTQTVRQISLGILDMEWHSKDPKDVTDVQTFEKQAMGKCEYLPSTGVGSTSSSFGHIFSGGYSSGYYSYKWAEVLDADAFEFFKENGIFNKDIAAHFRDHVLSQGGTQHPMTLYKNFRGKEPNPEALLKRAGLLN
jgi:Zn-dependent oligopeptidase